MKRLLISGALVIGLFSPFIDSSAHAAESVESNPTSTLTTYLQAIEEKNVDEMINFVQDDRYGEENLTLQKNEYTKKINRQSLTDYKIIDSQVIDENHQQINAELTFDNGEIVQVPFSLENNNDTWKVHISYDSLEEEDGYEVIKEGKQIPSSSTLATTKVSWDFSGRAGGSTFYSTNSFNISGTSATISGTQTHGYVSNGWPVSITYQVVKKHWYGDTVWGGVTVNGSGSFSKSISGTGNMNDVNIKFKTAQGNTSSMAYKGNGKLTQ